MEEILRNLSQKAAEKQQESKKFFARLRKKPPKNLDYVMQELHGEAFSRIDCLACANCCKTTGPLFTNADIERLAKHFRMKPSVFMDTYLRVDEDGDHVLQQTPCTFLGADNYCSVYDVRPKACREYPHTNRKKVPSDCKFDPKECINLPCGLPNCGGDESTIGLKVDGGQ